MSTITDFVDAKGLAKRITAVKEELAHLLHIEGLLGVKPRGKRGRPAKVLGDKIGNGKPAAKRGRKVGKRGALGEGITKLLSTKGKEGAHVKAIAEHLGVKTANVTAWMYTTGKTKVKKVKPGTFALKE